MPAVMPKKLNFISSQSDPKQAIMDAVGDALDHVDIPGGYLLVGTYIQPEKTAGGIWRPDNTKSEDLWQGSLGLVLKRGPRAFVDDGIHEFHGWEAKVGDWVLFRFSSSWEQHLNGVSVRWVPDSEIKGTTTDPTLFAS